MIVVRSCGLPVALVAPLLCDWCGEQPRLHGLRHCSPECEAEEAARIASWEVDDEEIRRDCAPCRGYDDHCGPLGCYPAVLDELLWSLFGWLWALGGRSELETWTPDETRCAGVEGDDP